MKIKIIAILFIVIIISIFLYPYSQNPKIQLSGPDSYQIGDLIELDASSSKVSNLNWTIIPPSDNFKIIEDNRKVVFSGKGENYTIVVMGCRGWKIDYLVHYLNNGKSKQNQNELNPFQTQLLSWLPDSFNNDSILKLAENFDNVASLIESGELQNIDDIIQATSFGNRNIADLNKFKLFLDKLQFYLENWSPGKNIKDHLIKWKEISQALRARWNAETSLN